jgi:hypothetical protein
MFDIKTFKDYFEFFECLDYENNGNFKKYKKEYFENKYVSKLSEYSNSIKKEVYIERYLDCYVINVNILENNIKIEYIVNIENCDIKNKLSIMNNTEYDNCYNAFKSFNNMFRIFLEYCNRDIDKILNERLKTLEVKLLEDKYKLKNINYNKTKDCILLNMDSFSLIIYNIRNNIFMNVPILYEIIKDSDNVNNYDIDSVLKIINIVRINLLFQFNLN